MGLINKIKLFFHWLKFKWILSGCPFVSERIPHRYSYLEIKQGLGFKLNEVNQIWYDAIAYPSLPNIITRSRIKDPEKLMELKQD